ncbi:MAG: ABC transporter ATP-binding protein [Saprospiraceae bacterium]|uniref:ABC transporter ATP-binding protein n=1 Tax=Candidatus Opimibacter skivensis TaxID=2982028 RepID=A0A9D7XRR9_9BACT|nr:ABC transporter ATP-binding protein [Candidatus Opimibacter skivensis]
MVTQGQTPARQLLFYLRRYKGPVLMNILCNILMAISMVISIPIIIPFFQILFGRVKPSTAPVAFSVNNIQSWLEYVFGRLVELYSQETALLLVCITFVIIFFLKNLFRYLSLVFMAQVRNGIVRDVRNSVFEKYMQLPLAYFTRGKKGDLMSRISTDVQEIEYSILNVIEAIFKEPIVIIGSITFMLFTSLRLTIFVFVLILITVFIVGRISRNLKRQSKEAQSRLADLVIHVEESLNGMRIIQGFNAQQYQRNRFSVINERYKKLLTRIMYRRDLSSPLSETLGIVIVSVLLWYGAHLVFTSEIKPETFFAFLYAFFNVIAPSKSFSSAYYNIQKGLAAVERVNEIIDNKEEILQKSEPKQIQSFEKSIVFENVGFQYNEGGDWVLKNINLTVPKGQVLAVIGSSGSGKSTLADLLPRFHDVTEGHIYFDGTDIREFNIKQLRSLMGIVNQDPVLFHDTIFNNIAFGRPEATMEEVINVATIAQMHDFIMGQPLGYNTVLGDRGSTLSGGERQRLTLARALLVNPPILILDEATASLDSKSERLVQEALSKVMEGRTSIVIAHRLSTVQHADQIIVLQDGKIVESGDHASLMQRQGEYYKFVGLQWLQ